jgi:hypothetical protein
MNSDAMTAIAAGWDALAASGVTDALTAALSGLLSAGLSERWPEGTGWTGDRVRGTSAREALRRLAMEAVRRRHREEAAEAADVLADVLGLESQEAAYAAFAAAVDAAAAQAAAAAAAADAAASQKAATDAAAAQAAEAARTQQVKDLLASVGFSWGADTRRIVDTDGFWDRKGYQEEGQAAGWRVDERWSSCPDEADAIAARLDAWRASDAADTAALAEIVAEATAVVARIAAEDAAWPALVAQAAAQKAARGHEPRIPRPPQGSMTDAQYGAALRQCAAEEAPLVAAFIARREEDHRALIAAGAVPRLLAALRARDML